MKENFDIEKELKREAEAMLPGDALKNDLKSRLFDNANSATGNANAQSEAGGKRKASRTRSVKPGAVKRRAYAMVAACLVVCLSLGLGLGLGLGLNDGGDTAPVYGDTYVAIDINPSFGVLASPDGTVKEVTALNDDAVLVLYGETFVGRPVDEVCAAIAELSFELGFLKKDGSVTVTACNDDASLQATVANAINTKISENDVLSSENVSVNLVSDGKSVLLNEANAKLSVSVDGLSFAEINALIKGYSKEDGETFTASITAEYAAELNGLRASALALCSAIEAYEANPTIATALSVLSNGIECISLYNAYYDVNIDLTNLPQYVDEFYTFVGKVSSGEDVAVENEVRSYVKLQIKLSAESNG